MIGGGTNPKVDELKVNGDDNICKLTDKKCYWKMVSQWHKTLYMTLYHGGFTPCEVEHHV